MKKSDKKALNLESYVNKTLEDTVYDLCKKVNENICAENGNADICLSIVDINGNSLYKETASIVRKVCKPNNLKESKSNFYKIMEVTLLRRRVNFEIDKLIVSEINIQVCKVRNKDEKYVKVDITVDGNPTLSEAFDYMIDHHLTTCDIAITSKTGIISVFTVTMSVSDMEHINELFSNDILNKNLSRYPIYSEDVCRFFIRL